MDLICFLGVFVDIICDFCLFIIFIFYSSRQILFRNKIRGNHATLFSCSSYYHLSISFALKVNGIRRPDDQQEIDVIDVLIAGSAAK